MKVVVSKHIYDLITAANSRNTGFAFKKDHCYRLIKNIIQVYNLNRDKCEDGYVMLCSEHLQSISHEYKSYIDWMERTGIIAIDKSYKNGDYCRHYKIIQPPSSYMEDDRERLVQVDFNPNDYLITLIITHKRIRGLSFMARWLKKLEIDDRTAHDLNWVAYSEDKIAPRTGFKKGQYHYEPYKINPSMAYEHRKQNIVSINSQQFYMSRDETSGRLHSNITGLSNKIFPALKINDQKLVGWDIANSQPFLCAALINLILDNEQKKGNFSSFFSSNPIPTPQTPFLSNPTLINYIQTYLPSISNSHSLLVMLEDSLSEADLIGVVEFQNLCYTGKLYEEIAKNVFEFEYKNENKRKVKDLFFTLFFTKPKNNKNGIPKFKKLYQGAHTIICLIKENSIENNYFPILLQCLESYYILERVCKRMHKEYPNAPLFTKHDSIYTTYKYTHNLKQTMLEEAEQLFGIIPKLNEA